MRVRAGDLLSKWGFVRKEIPCQTFRAPHPVQIEFQARSAKIPLKHIPGPLPATELVGIINVTPDSFSDGNLFIDPHKAALHARNLWNEGARVLDIGAESTRPGAKLITWEEEWRRLDPVLNAIRTEFQNDSLKPEISVDTRRPEVAKLALAAGANWLNDVSGFSDPGMLELAGEGSAQLVCMHNLGVPPSKEHVLSSSSDALTQILAWGEEVISKFNHLGITSDRLILDPGIGFGKTPQQSLKIILGAEKLLRLGCRILIGHSRKSFLSLFSAKPANERDAESAALSAVLASKGMHYLRVHNVAANFSAII